MTAGSSNTGLMKEAHTAASVRMATVIREETATATEAMASPSGVLGVIHQQRDFVLRVAAHKPCHVPQVVVIHGDKIIVGLIVPPGHLPGGLACTADAMLSQLAPGRRIDRYIIF